LVEEERALSYSRQVLQRRIYLMQAELVRQGSTAHLPEKLVHMLMWEEGRP
jgi:hypothetical protein